MTFCWFCNFFYYHYYYYYYSPFCDAIVAMEVIASPW